jgi:predicted AAA+ superfamily ATPase
MKNIWESCTFSDEIISTDFNRAKFAIELHEFLDKTAGPVYQDPNRFFENTFPTNQMKLLVKDSLVRLESGKGQPVTVINTGFGGGKTHTILLLHHIINNPKEGLEFIKKINLTTEYGVEKIPKAKMIAIDCRKISKNTLWGEIADQLGQYNKFKEFLTIKPN